MGNTRTTSVYLQTTDNKYTSLKSECPFLVRFNYIGKRKLYRGPLIFFRLR